jgi:hypothetical protein
MKIEPDLIKGILQWCENNLPDYHKERLAEELELSTSHI